MHNGLDHPEIDMLKEQNETTEQESNLFTVMDEHIPSPPEIEAEDVLVLPEIQSMTDCIRLHFEEKLVEELSRRLRCGELLVPSGGRLYQELPWAGVENDEAESGPDPGSQEPKDGVPAVWEDPRFSAPGVRVAGVRPKKGAIVWFNYRRVAECGVEADLTLEMEIELRWYTLRKTVCQRYDVDMWFDMEEDTLAISNHLLGQTYDALSSYDVKIRLADYFQEAEQAVSIGTKGVILDFLADGTGIGIGKVAETPGAIECGWPLKLSDPLCIAYGGTGAASAENALAALGGVKKAGDTMTGNLGILGNLYPSLLLLPTYNGTSSRTVLEGSYEGAASLAAWEDAAGDNRRMLEIRTKALQASLDWAIVLRACEAGVWNNYRVFHSGMPGGVPVANGGTGAANAADARKNLGANNAGNLTTGTLPSARLPFKFAYDSTTINGSSAAYVDYSAAGFTSVPVVLITYATTSGNWSGDNGAIKVYNKTTTSCQVIVGGNFNTSRAVDWFAFGT